LYRLYEAPNDETEGEARIGKKFETEAKVEAYEPRETSLW
jgi:hypothetical protein